MDKKVVMAAAYSGRIFRAAVGAPQLDTLWDGQVYDLDLWAIPKTAANKDAAKRFIAFAMEPAHLAAQAQLIAYGPMRKSAIALVGKHPIINVDMKSYLPTTPDHMKKGAEIRRCLVERAWRGAWRPFPGLAGASLHRRGHAPSGLSKSAAIKLL